MTQKTLLIGPARTGKTGRVLAEFTHALKTAPPLGEEHVLVLPSLEHADRIVTRLLAQGMPGFFFRRVTTLERLLCETLGVGDEGVASNVTRILLMREILAGRRWEAFEEVQSTPGFLSLALSFMSELKESRVDALFFRKKMNELKTLEPDLAPKYEALAALYESYESGLAERGLRDRQDALTLYQKRKSQAKPRPIRFQKIWLDGFFDFSELQLAAIGELCETSREVLITLTCDPAPERADLFETVLATRDGLERMGFKIEIARDNPPGARAAIQHIEKSIFSRAKPKALPPPEGVEIFAAIGIEGEVEMIAREIRRLIRSGAYRFSDFAVLLREIGDYAGVIRSVFERYGVPVEIHERERLIFSPMIQVVVRLLRLFSEGWKRADLLEFLKSGYVRSLGAAERSYEWAAALEHEAMRKGIFQSREAWLKCWNGPEAGEFEAQKTERLGALAALEDGLRQATGARRAGRLLLEAVQKTFGIYAPSASDAAHRRRDNASYVRLEAILDEIENSFSSAGESYSFEAFAERFFRLAELDLYSLHEKDKNQVQLYSVSLARQKEYRVVFLAGLLERRFPVQFREEPLLSVWERRLFNGTRTAGLLKERLPRQSLERYLFYVALTRTSEKLYLTYPRIDLEGKESLPSYYVDEVRALFSEIQPRRQELARPYPELSEVTTGRELEMAVMGELWKTRPGARPALAALTRRLLDFTPSRERFARAFYQVEDALTDPAIRGLEAFHARETSATSLEEYAKCPFRYYAKRVLKLRDVEEDLNVMTRGILLHEVLEKCFAEWAGNPGILEDKVRACQNAWDRLETALEKTPLILPKQYQQDLEREDLRQTLERFLELELERLKTSPLKPRYFEYDFGGKDSPNPAFILAYGGREIRVRGKIDRIDVEPQGKAALVIDYKRTATFKRGDLETGTSLQLPIYSLVLEKILKLLPVGAELYSIKGREKNGFYHAGYQELLPALGKRKMLLSGPQFRELLARSEFFIKKFSREMEAKRIDVQPRVCDTYCPYSAVCRIEKWRLPILREDILEKDREEQKALEQKPAPKRVTKKTPKKPVPKNPELF